MLVKICGIQTQQTAKQAAFAGADFIGFVFASSKRRITPEKARAICDSLPSSIKKVGVFVNESVAKMEQVAKLVGLDYIQLHGDEPAAIAKQLSLPVIKAFPAQMDQVPIMKKYPCDYVLLDHPHGGGTGKTFDWLLYETLHREVPNLLLAGGLAPENVSNAIAVFQPAGVDVSSGVETNGEKDPLKIKQFITNAKNRKEDAHVKNQNNLP
ncbi:phosphoribosylanthranilate isomerase [Virgibacillus sp. 179-BFC.A HS]|uniref:N-(5'-phosphoribosyl)anthranilate isomerase n=1 Tax=Tigheibacillus jepli TaxID=3035914 RepID=A0ABU5CM62_9BACI|nr:phosphoribosylanthranilate isomerase [Virgibacillus sp. 179-BFC.A HS]MDY0406991.1 phosphoribosylanthranilate isomerase [Virgibacillus sp. 179-BFC.A HS]